MHPLNELVRQARSFPGLGVAFTVGVALTDGPLWKTKLLGANWRARPDQARISASIRITDDIAMAFNRLHGLIVAVVLRTC
jgi:hypothetical protein